MGSLVIGIFEHGIFYVEHVPIQVTKIYSQTEFQLMNMKTGQTFEIDDQSSVEVLPDVRISCGNRGKIDTARVVIQAPRHIEILRAVLYRKKYGGQSGGGYYPKKATAGG